MRKCLMIITVDHYLVDYPRRLPAIQHVEEGIAEFASHCCNWRLWLLWKGHTHGQEQSFTARVPKVLGTVSRELFEGRTTFCATGRSIVVVSMCFLQPLRPGNMYQAKPAVVRNTVVKK